jgi:hypothetical protein
MDCCIIDCVIETIQSNGYTQFCILLISHHLVFVKHITWFEHRHALVSAIRYRFILGLTYAYRLIWGSVPSQKLKKTCPPTTTPPRHYSTIRRATTWHTTIQRATLWHITIQRATLWHTTNLAYYNLAYIRRTTTKPIMASREFRAQLSSGLWLPCSQRAISVAWDITTTEGVSGSQLSSGL